MPPTETPDQEPDSSLPEQSSKKYDPRFCDMARNICQRMGATNQDLACLFGVHINTIKNWMVRHPEFAECLELGKDVANKRVERALYTRAVGYEYQSEQVFFDRKTASVVRTPITVHVPPDTWACNTWLMNRDPDRWRHKMELNNIKPAEVTDQPLSADEWDKVYGGSGGRTN